MSTPSMASSAASPDTATVEDDPTHPQGAAITIDIFHDTVCPWCRIGVASLQRVLAGWDGPSVEMHWHPFLLNPNTPPEGEPFRESLASKMGQDPAPVLERVSEAGAAVGVSFDWAAIRRTPNSIRSHLLYAILPEDRRTAMVERIGMAYFEQGRDIGDLETLKAVAAEGGMDPELTAQALERPELQSAIVSEVTQAAQLGISGVPLFIFDNRLAVSGAQSPETFASALAQVVDGRRDDAAVSSGSDETAASPAP